jgi:4-aminobutyrate aminotransferase-like enzyme
MKENIYKSPKILTSLPGPNTKKLIQRKVNSFTPLKPGNIAARKEHGSWIEDVDGNVFLDFKTNVNTVGRAHPNIIRAVKEQLTQLTIGSRLSPPFLECAERLKEMLNPPLKYGKINYATTGSEAIDLGLRVAREFTERKLIISFFRTHYGRGSSEVQRYSTDHHKGGLSNIISDILFVPWPYCYRCPWKMAPENCSLRCIDYFEELFLSFSPDKIAGILFEGIPANGGVLVPPDDYYHRLKSLSEKNGIQLIDDEVFSGFGKTGKFLAVDHWDITPDIVCLGKSMGGGFPISAVATRSEIIDKCMFLSDGTLGSFSGSIVSCAATLATIETMEKDKLLSNASNLGHYILKRLIELSEKTDLIGDVRGRGLMIGIELVKDRKSKEPAIKEAEIIQRKSYENGLLVSSVGAYRNVIRLIPHLIVTRGEIDTGLEILEKAFATI